MAYKYETLIKELQNKIYQPVYLLHGDEPYYVDLISNYIEKNVLTEAEKGFNLTVLYGKDATYRQVMDAAGRYPMMAQYQVIILKEAQAMRDLEKLQPYIENPSKSTLLIICYKNKKYDKRKTFYKAVDKKHAVFQSMPLRDHQLPAFINQYLGRKKFKIEEKAIMMLAEFVGTDLSNISNELEKLILNCDPAKAITPDDIAKNIGISRDFNVFELSDALAAKNTSKVYRIVNHFAANPRAHPMPFTMGILYNFYSKLHLYLHYTDKPANEAAKLMGFNNAWPLKPFQAAKNHYSLAQAETAMSLLHEYDLRSKGVNNAVSDHGELLKELAFKLLN